MLTPECEDARRQRDKGEAYFARDDHGALHLVGSVEMSQRPLLDGAAVMEVLRKVTHEVTQRKTP